MCVSYDTNLTRTQYYVKLGYIEIEICSHNLTHIYLQDII